MPAYQPPLYVTPRLTVDQQEAAKRFLAHAIMSVQHGHAPELMSWMDAAVGAFGAIGSARAERSI